MCKPRRSGTTPKSQPARCRVAVTAHPRLRQIPRTGIVHSTAETQGHTPENASPAPAPKHHGFRARHRALALPHLVLTVTRRPAGCMTSVRGGARRLAPDPEATGEGCSVCSTNGAESGRLPCKGRGLSQLSDEGKENSTAQVTETLLPPEGHPPTRGVSWTSNCLGFSPRWPSPGSPAVAPRGPQWRPESDPCSLPHLMVPQVRLVTLPCHPPLSSWS